MSSKEDCFEEAADAYQDATDKDLGLQHKQPWRQNMDNTWSPEPRGFWAGVNSMLKWLRGEGHAGSVKQIRVPDVTVNTPKGPLVVDLKFTRADGTVDSWGTKPGKGNGSLQQDDYNDINKQTDPKAKDLKLDPESCGCQARGEPSPVQVPVTDPLGGLYVVPMAPLGGVPMPALPPMPMPAPMPVPVF